MFAQPWLVAAAAMCAVAAALWGRATARLSRAARRIESETANSGSGREAVELARAAFDKDLHTTLLYSVLTVGLFFMSLSKSSWFELPLLGIGVPVVVSVRFGTRLFDEARLAESRAQLERRAEEVLAQEDLAPRRWAERLAPEDLPVIEGFELGTVYEPGTGLMAGDFYDVYPTGGGRLAVVIGDVAGHGVEPSITAFQVKYLLRNFLTQYRDPAQALEELNKVLSATGRPEDLVSVCVVLFDPAGATATVFRKAGLVFAAIGELDAPAGDPATTVLVIGEGALQVDTAVAAGKLSAYVAAGGRIVVLAQDRVLPDLPVKTTLEPREWVSMPFVRAPQHPVLARCSYEPMCANQRRPEQACAVPAGVGTDQCRPEQACAVPAEIGTSQPECRNCASLFRPTSASPRATSECTSTVLAGVTSWDLHFWNPDHVSARGAYSKPDGGAFVTLVDSGCETGLEWMQMMECYRGLGCYLLNQFPVVGRYDVEPMAGELLDRLMTYATGEKAFRVPTGRLLVLAEPTSPVVAKLRNVGVSMTVANVGLAHSKTHRPLSASFPS